MSDEVRQRFTRLTGGLRPQLIAVAMRFCSQNNAIADDLVQEAYLRAWRKFHSLHDAAKALPWLIRILRNCWIDVCRRRVADLPLAELPDRVIEVEEPSVWQQITPDDFQSAIDQLEEPYRSIVILHDVDHLSNADIVKRMNIPYATVGTRLHRAHKKLRALLHRQLVVKGE